MNIIDTEAGRTWSEVKHSVPDHDDRRVDPERMWEDTTTGINFALVRRKSFGRGYWAGYGSATVCALIWVVIDLWATGRLGSWGL